MLEPAPPSDAAPSAAPEPPHFSPVEALAGVGRGERRRSSDAYVDQLRTLLAKASERVRAAEQATEAVQRELATVRARLAEEIANAAILTEMAGEAERRAMKAEATAESLRTHLSGLRGEPVADRVPRQAAVPAGAVPSARQVLDGLVSHLHALPGELAPAAAVPSVGKPVPTTSAPQATSTPQSSAATQPASTQSVDLEPVDAEPANAAPATAKASSPQPAPEPAAAEKAPLAGVTILPGASSPRRRWGR